MKENVGQTDQVLRAVLGPLLLSAGYAWLGGKEGKAGGLLTMIAGALVTETAITRTCPLNEVLGIDTTQPSDRPATSALFAGGRGGFGLGRAAAAQEFTAEAEPETGMQMDESAGEKRSWLDYSNFLNAAASLSFISDEETAEAAVKAVLGILASRLEEEEARRLIARLPDPLTYENLRGHQVHANELSVDQYYGNLSRQFHLTTDQAQVLAVTILRLVKEALDTQGMRDIERSLPDDWTELIERV